jgi:alkylated DNA repair dioxygenase AlkB
MPSQPDLFSAPVVPGLSLSEPIVFPAEEAGLIARIDAAELVPFRFQGWQGKRLTRAFGWSYDFEGGTFARAEPIPGWLEALRLRAATFAGLPHDALVQALLIRYDPGAGIGWHRDRPVFGDVVGISLGAPATLRLRRRNGDGFDRASARLDPRCAYHLSGEVRREWEHSIVPMERTRWSITFRALSGKGRELARAAQRIS